MGFIGDEIAIFELIRGSDVGQEQKDCANGVNVLFWCLAEN